ncbi:protein DECREASED SIZE EXCLUSION LIMIT 1 isoform X2 [Physcomitrium patens]|uniref:Uncharacterized protein n=1 Tax=Physcomitrium patens TaxID=3218 RepID=A0A2K1IV36_PHYPA|nr:protein DECREASED SIZE EXCLUSION LIMIT 1-like isoform X2 [Physcomitrium patens]PNR33128.1 hypothetical protein PHYPA_025071 [Physcomitrium patens]|eukprot:XP_024358152.1 protein DECREASED SIZE EXCLUSION LIMIT 1-like isoform X2 [Physcomitrella patens]
MALATSRRPAPDPVAVLRAHRAAVNVLAFHTPSGALLSGDADGELKIWDLVKHRPVFSSRVHTPSAGVLGIGVSSALNNKIISQGRDGTVKCWQLTESSLSRQPILSVKSESYHFCKLAVARRCTTNDESHEDTRGAAGQILMAIAGNDTSKVEIWDITSGQRVQLLSPKDSSVGMCMSLHMIFQSGEGDQCTVVAGYEDGSMLMWDTRHPAAPLLQSKQHKEPVLSLVLDGPGLGGISGSADGQLTLFSFNSTEKVYTPKKKFEGQAGIGDIALRGDDKIFATSGWDHRVSIYDYRRRKPLAFLKYHKEIVNGVAFSEDKKWLASGSKDSTVALWSLYPPSEGTSKSVE